MVVAITCTCTLVKGTLYLRATAIQRKHLIQKMQYGVKSTHLWWALEPTTVINQVLNHCSFSPIMHTVYTGVALVLHLDERRFMEHGKVFHLHNTHIYF